MMKTFGVVILVLCMCMQSAWATCYSPEQFRAEQAVRFHTRMMVMGLYCQKVLGQNTYAAYQSFTQRNQKVIRDQENRMIAYYKQAKMPNPERKLHSFRTDLANQMSIQAGKSSVTFCRQYAPVFQHAKGMIPNDFKAWIEHINVQQPVATSRPVCVAAQRRK